MSRAQNSGRVDEADGKCTCWLARHSGETYGEQHTRSQRRGGVRARGWQTKNHLTVNEDTHVV